jgi:methyl-accepting chemotaxis protein
VPTTTAVTAIAAGDPIAATEALIQRVRAAFAGDSGGGGAGGPALLTLFCGAAQPLDVVAPAVAAAFPEATLVGASTSGAFTEEGGVPAASALFAVGGEYRVRAGMGTGLRADPERAVAEALAGLPLRAAGYPHKTAIMLIDPLAGNGAEATLIAASLVGPDVRLVGGAAGDDLAMRRTLCACGGRASSDAVVIALVFSRSPLGVGTAHGHVPLSGPLRITRASGDVVHEIDGRAAWSVWRDETRERARLHGVDVDALSRAGASAHLLRYEAGLAAGASAFTVRAPLSRGDDGSLHFACGVPEGTVIRIMESVPERQVASARAAARGALEGLGGPAAGALVFDCVCRDIILGADFGRAVRGMAEELGGAPIAGLETYGEIALDAGDMSGFHNSSSVVLAFPAG